MSPCHINNCCRLQAAIAAALASAVLSHTAPNSLISETSVLQVLQQHDTSIKASSHHWLAHLLDNMVYLGEPGAGKPGKLPARIVAQSP